MVFNFKTFVFIRIICWDNLLLKTAYNTWNTQIMMPLFFTYTWMIMIWKSGAILDAETEFISIMHFLSLSNEYRLTLMNNVYDIKNCDISVITQCL